MEGRTTLKGNIFSALSANFIVAIVGFLGSFIFPKILTIDDYALYHKFTLYLSYITILHLGFPSGMAVNYAGKEFESIDKKQYKSELILLLLILTVGTEGLLLGAFVVKSTMLIYISLAVIPVGVIGSYKSLLQSWNRFKVFSRVSAILALSVPILAIAYYFVIGGLPGYTYIAIYLITNWIVTAYIIYENVTFVRGSKRNKLLSKRNFETEKIGFALVAGNYINTLFVSADKQFVNLFFNTEKFAFYSFAMSMQSLMTVFITSISQPLFPAMAQGKFHEKEYNDVKSLLIVFGSLSGCAYFVVSIIVKFFIPKYMESLSVVSVYFVVFPAMAVINCLYTNMYKVFGKMRMYVTTLVAILVLAITLNAGFVLLLKDYRGVAIATTITYYIWFIAGFKQFDFMNLTKYDILYLLIYTCGFFIITRIQNYFIGFVVYGIFILTLAVICYRKLLENYLTIYFKGKL
jgi:O-antigen/teichoic acid export membrane protein